MNTDEKKITNPVKSIRAKCLDRCCGQLREVELCPNTQYALHPFRFGKNPFRTKREMTEDQRAAAADRLRRAREKQNRG